MVLATLLFRPRRSRNPDSSLSPRATRAEGTTLRGIDMPRRRGSGEVPRIAGAKASARAALAGEGGFA
jgi:hypothetical protein